MSYLNDFKYWDVTPDTAKKKTTVKTSRAKLPDGSHLIVKTWNAANDGTVFSLNYNGKELEVWEFERLLFPNLSDLFRCRLNLFDCWQLTVLKPCDLVSEDIHQTWSEVQEHQFDSTFNVNHWNVAKHIAERIALVREVLKNESI